MIPRRLQHMIQERLAVFPSVVLLGSRQVGKTTLAEIPSKGAQYKVSTAIIQVVSL
jgi:predicted AAA+ superfamily ATPase